MPRRERWVIVIHFVTGEGSSRWEIYGRSAMSEIFEGPVEVEVDG